MMSKEKFLFLLFSCSLFGCASYQSHLGAFRGPGSYLGPSLSQPSQAARHYGPFELAWPVQSVQISQPYRPRSNRHHQGLDLRGARGTPILAAHRGRVIYVGRGFRGYGKMVMVEYNSQWASLYAHLNRISVREGDFVEIGDVVGNMGRTGRATGVHLHFELIKNKLPVDPLAYLPDPDSSRVAGR